MSANKPVENGADDDKKQDRACVVHVSCCHRELRGKRHPSDNEEQINQREYVNGDAPFA